MNTALYDQFKEEWRGQRPPSLLHTLLLLVISRPTVSSGSTRSSLISVVIKLCVPGNLSSVQKLSNVVLQAFVSQL